MKAHLETAAQFGDLSRSAARGFRDLLKGRLDVLEGRAKCADCGATEELTPGGASSDIIVRCASCWTWVRALAQREAMRRASSR